MYGHLESKVSDLVSEYIKVIAKDGGYKDKDCHFFIERCWSYGEDVGWKAVHEGYINRFEIQGKTYGHVLKRLILELQRIIIEAEE